MVDKEVLQLLVLALLGLQPPVQPIVVVDFLFALPLSLVVLKSEELDPVVPLVDVRCANERSINSCSQENVPVAFHRLSRCLISECLILHCLQGLHLSWLRLR